MGAQIAITDSGTTVFYDLLDEDSDKIKARIERILTGYIVDRKVVEYSRR